MLKDSYEMEVPEIKEKWNNVWCHLALTRGALTLMLMRQDCVSDGGIGDRNKGLEAFSREISECGDAESGDFGGTACSTAAQRFCGIG